MHTLDQAQIAAAIETFDVEGYLQARNIPVKETGTGELLLTCLRCGREKLYLSRRNKRWICHKCGSAFRGWLPKLIAEIDHISQGQAVQWLYEQAGRPGVPIFVQRERPVETVCQLPDGFRRLDDPWDERQRVYFAYAVQVRRFEPQLIQRYGFGYCRNGPYAGRLVVPVTEGEQLTSWIARDITGQSSRKVLTPPGNSQGTTLFNLDAVRGRGEAVLVEGVFDALRVPGRCVATFGKKLSERQVVLLKAADVRTLIFAWDDDARLEAVRAALRWTQSFPRVRVARLSGHDPAEMTPQEVEACVLMAETVDELDLLSSQFQTVFNKH